MCALTCQQPVSGLGMSDVSGVGRDDIRQRRPGGKELFFVEGQPQFELFQFRFGNLIGSRSKGSGDKPER